MSPTRKSDPEAPGSRDEHPGCRAIAGILDRIGDKWTVLVIRALSDGPLRYSEVQRQIGGISQRMLTLTLKGLEQDGLVKRTMFPTIPPRVDYELTELSGKLNAVLQPLYEFAVNHQQEISEARMRFAAQRDP